MDLDPIELYYGLHTRSKPKHQKMSIEFRPGIPARAECYIYVLVDPIYSGEIRYVGRTNKPFSRYLEHYENKKIFNYKLSAWIEGLRYEGELPIMRIIDQCDYVDQDEIEDHWIEVIGEDYSLFNQVKNLR